MAQISDMLPDILPHVGNCPDTVAEAAVLKAAIALCSKTPAWKEVETYRTTERMADIELDAPTDAVIVAVCQALVDGTTPVKPISLAELHQTSPDWQTEKGAPRFAVQLQHGVLRMVPAGAAKVEVVMQLAPSFSATSLPDHLLSHPDYREYIRLGALALLLSTTGTEWYNPQLAAQFSAIQSDILVNANITARRGQMGARRRTVGSFL